MLGAPALIYRKAGKGLSDTKFEKEDIVALCLVIGIFIDMKTTLLTWLCVALPLMSK